MGERDPAKELKGESDGSKELNIGGGDNIFLNGLGDQTEKELFVN